MRDSRAQFRQCPYCSVEFPDEEMTDDHVIARSWFPTTATQVRKWQVRACQDCNREKSALEGDLLGRIAECLPERPDLAGIKAKARRSIDPRSATSARDAKHRFNRREAMRRSIVDVPSKSDPDLLPYFKDNFDAGSRTGIRISRPSLDGLVELWVRGIHSFEVGQVIPSEYEVLVTHVDDRLRAQALSGVMEHAKIIQKGPGVEVKIFHAEEPEEFGTLYAFNIWDYLKCTASVLRRRQPGR